MKKINDYLLMIIGNYLEVQDVLRLSATCKQWYKVFKDYFEFYKRECKNNFCNNLNLFKNLLMNCKSSSTDLSKLFDPGFLWKGNATKVWRDLVLEGLSLRNQWKKGKFINEYFDKEVFNYLGDTLFDILKSPDLTVPALIKEDNNVDFHSVYSQYLYEHMFRMKSIYAGRKPAATFTFLSENELKIKQAFIECMNSVDEMAEDVMINDECNTFLNLRWYWANPNYSNCSDSITYASTQFTTQLLKLLKSPDINSNINMLMWMIFDTITFHWKLSYELISDFNDDFRFLQEYDKRWNAYIASMIKVDEILTPLGQIINKVYRRVYPDMLIYPQFTFLRFFIIIWRREVYNLLKESIEDWMVKIFRKFHKSWLNYSKEEHTLRKAKKKKTSLSDYFSGSVAKTHISGGFNSMMNPMLSAMNLNQEETKNSFADMAMTDQEDEHDYVMDLEMMYGKQEDTKIPNMEKPDRECIKQILVDVMDISLHEYSIHYICHSENEYMTPFTDLKSKLKHEIFKFYRTSCESTPFKLWSEIVDEHCKILSTFLPVTLLKELHDHRFNFVKKYTKNRISIQLKKFMEQKSNKKKTTRTSQGLQVFSANSDKLDPTILTEEEYLEITVAEYINTPFHEYLVSCLKKKSSKNTILALLAHIKENEVDIMKVYNQNYQINRKFITDVEFKNSTIEKYKKPRGFSLKLKPAEAQLYSMEDGISSSMLEKLKVEREKEKAEMEQQRRRVEQDFSNSFSIDTDSCEDEIPFSIGTNKLRTSNPEKRTSKFEPFGTLKRLKNQEQHDFEMSDEESKSEVSKEEDSERPSLGSLSAFINNNFNWKPDVLESWPFMEDSTSLQGLRLDRSSNVSAKPSLPTASILRFSDLEKMDEDVEMEETPEALSFKRS